MAGFHSPTGGHRDWRWHPHPSVKMFGQATGGALIRINPKDAYVFLPGVGFERGGLEGIEVISVYQHLCGGSSEV
jgi:hypothetical protein